MKRANFAIGIAAALLVAPLGAGTAVADIKIGAVLSVTGPASFLGDPEKKTVEMFVADINGKGGVNGQPIKLIVYDDEIPLRYYALDFIHLTDEGHTMIAAALLPRVLAAIGKRSDDAPPVSKARQPR